MADNIKLQVLVDCSGSMAEMGRPRLVLRLLEQVREYLSTWHFICSVDVCYLSEAEIRESGEPQGKLDLGMIAMKVERLLSSGTVVLFIGDGCYSSLHASRMESALSRRQVPRAAVSLGAGCDMGMLKRLVGTRGRVFSAEEIGQALSFLLLSDTVPESPATDSGDDEDGWE